MTRDEKIAGIKAGVMAGMSAKEIAIDLCAPSRNAIIGFSRRAKVALNSPVRRGEISNSPKSVERRRLRVREGRGKSVAPKTRKSQKVAPPPAVVETPKFVTPIEIGSPVHLMEMSRSRCAFPLWPDRMGEAYGKVSFEEAMFCGCAVKEGSSFCAEHHAVVWMKAPPRKRKKADVVKDNSSHF